MGRSFVLIIAAVVSLGLVWLAHSPASPYVPREATTMLHTAQAAHPLPCDNCPDTPLTAGAGCLAGCGAAVAIPPTTACPVVVQSGERPSYAAAMFANRAITPADRPPKSAA